MYFIKHLGTTTAVYFWVSAICYPLAMISRNKRYFPVAEGTRVILERKWYLSR